MIKKLAVITLSALVLGGCTLTDNLKQDDAAKDMVKEDVSVTSSPSTSMMPQATADPSLDSLPKTSSSTDVDSLEADINNTKVLDEDFSDLN